jgi:hypothetical protein
MSQIEVDKVIPQSGTALQVGESGDTITIPAGATITNNGTANGFGSADTEKVKVSSNDTTAGFLNGKLVAGTNISLTEGTDGGNETLTAALSGTISTAQIGANQVTGAKLNTDVISAQTELATAPANTDELLISDAGTLKRIDVSLVGGKNTPNFYVTKSANQSISANTWTKITLDQELFDSDNVFGSDKFTAPSAGKYLITITVRADDINASQHVNIALYKNGAYFNGATNDRAFANTNGHELFLQSTTLLNLAQNDYLELYARANGNAENISGATGGTPTGQESYTSMQGFKIIE